MYYHTDLCQLTFFSVLSSTLNIDICCQLGGKKIRWNLWRVPLCIWKRKKSSFDQPSIKLRHKILLQRDYHMTTKLKKKSFEFFKCHQLPVFGLLQARILVLLTQKITSNCCWTLNVSPRWKTICVRYRECIGYDQLCNIYTRWWLRACITTNYSIRFPRDRDKKYIIMQSINLISFHGTGAIVSHMKFTSYSREKDARTNLTWQWEYFTWNLCYIQVNIKHVNNILSM